jgi:hypothetical protein
MRKILFPTIVSFIILSLSSCSKTTGTISMNYTKAIAVYGDLDSLRNIPLLESPREIDKPIGHFIGNNCILIGERAKGIHLYDNNNISNPSKVGFLNIPFCKEFYVEGNFLYAESGYDFLKIDLTNIRIPLIVKRVNNAFHKFLKNDKDQVILGFVYQNATDEFEYNSEEAKDIRKEGKLYIDYRKKMIPLSTVPSMFTGNNGKSKGTINRICIIKNHIYLVGNDKMHIFSNNHDVYKVKDINIQNNTETIYTDKDRLYLGSQTQLTIYNLSNPASPRKVGDVEHQESCDPVLAVGDYAYSTLRSVTNEGCAPSENILMVVEIKKSGRAKEVQTIGMKSPYGLALINDYLFVGEGQNGLTIFNAKNRDNLKEAKKLNEIVAFDIMQHPSKSDIIITTHQNGLREYKIDWNTLSLKLEKTLYYN